MRKSNRTLTIPAIRKLREAIESGNFGGWLIESGEKACAGSVRVKYTLKKRPWVLIIEARRQK